MFVNVLLAITGALTALLGLIVFLNNTQSKVNRIFFYCAVSFVVWITTNLLTNLSGTPSMALIWARATIVGAVFVVYFFVVLSLNFPIERTWSRWKKVLLFLPLLIFLVLSPTALNVVSTSAHGNQFVPGPLYTVLLIYFPAYTIMGSVYFIKAFRRTTGYAHQQIRFVLAGILFSFVPGFILNAIIPLFGYAQTAIYGPIVVATFVIFVSYAIVRHRLLDIRLIVARTLAYVLLLATLGGLYSLGLFGISDFLLGGNSVKVEQLAINMGLSLILVFTFQPLRRFFERVTDRIFYRDKYDSEVLLNQITQTLASEIDLATILDKTITMICQAVRVNFGQYMIFEEGKVYKVEHYGKTPEQLISTTELKVLNRSMLVADELEAGQRKDVMDKHGVRLSLVLRTKDEFVGFLLLGDKLSGDIYSTQDIELFEILANELAVAIVNAKAYEEIAQFNITLQDKVNQATARLRTANKHLKELDEAKDEFISMASHQLRTPLTTIKGYISMLQEGDAGKITPEQNEFLAYAYDGSERMVGLISDLLNVSRMNSGKFMIDRTDIDPVAMVSDEVRQLMSHADAKKLKLIWTPPKQKIPHVQLDDNKTRQVIMNFIDNAIYYTKQGSVTVTLAQKGDNIELRVTDTGIGVPKEARDKLFGKFFRAGNAQQVRPDGTGLGLYLAKRVVQDQGGSIIFESTEGKGSTFGFLLPIKAPVTAAPPTTKPTSKTQPANPTAVVASAKAATKVAVGS